MPVTIVEGLTGLGIAFTSYTILIGIIWRGNTSRLTKIEKEKVDVAVDKVRHNGIDKALTANSSDHEDMKESQKAMSETLIRMDENLKILVEDARSN